MKSILILILFFVCSCGNNEVPSAIIETQIDTGSSVMWVRGDSLLRWVNTDEKRYFFISYYGAESNGSNTYGNFYIISDTLPSYNELEKTAYNLAKGTVVAFKKFSIVGLHEFKDSVEYYNFKKN